MTRSKDRRRREPITRLRAHLPGGASSEAAFSQEEERAAETFSGDNAMLLIDAVVTVANADGTISADEHARIMSQANEAGADAEDRRALEQELANPRPVDELLAQVRD